MKQGASIEIGLEKSGMSCEYALVGDYKSAQFLGGAALVDAYIVEFLRKKGFDIDYFAVNQTSNDWSELVSGSYRGVIYTNLAGMSLDQLQWIYSEGPPYILFRHDIPSIVYRPALASPDLQGRFSQLFNNARCTIFISNLQLSKYQEVVRLGPTTVIPPPIDFASFSDFESQERSGLLYLGPLSELRGLRRSIEKWQSIYPNEKFDAYGNIEDNGLADFAMTQGVKIYPALARSEVAKVMSRYSVLVHHPNFIDSFSIKIVEAELRGMSLLVDRERIGRFSYQADAHSLAVYMEQNAGSRIAKIVDAFL